jgi:hypothetical protein
VCKEKGWRIGACDWIPVIHLGNGTVRDNQDDPIISKYNQLADQEMYEYFRKSEELWNNFVEQRLAAEAYTHYKIN